MTMTYMYESCIVILVEEHRDTCRRKTAEELRCDVVHGTDEECPGHAMELNGSMIEQMEFGWTVKSSREY